MPLPRILIVEDSDTAWYRYCTVLGSRYHLRRAASGRQAIFDLVQEKPDLILLDWTLDTVMPWDMGELDEPHTPRPLIESVPARPMTGLEVLRVIKGTAFKSIPVIVLTGHNSLRPRLLSKLFRADQYLTKPFTDAELLTAVAIFIETEVQAPYDIDLSQQAS